MTDYLWTPDFGFLSTENHEIADTLRHKMDGERCYTSDELFTLCTGLNRCDLSVEEYHRHANRVRMLLGRLTDKGLLVRVRSEKRPNIWRYRLAEAYR